MDLPGTPYNRAKQARDYILGAIRERVEARKAEYLAGSAKRDTLLSWFASAKVADGDPLDIEELSVRACAPWLPAQAVPCLNSSSAQSSLHGKGGVCTHPYSTI